MANTISCTVNDRIINRATGLKQLPVNYLSKEDKQSITLLADLLVNSYKCGNKESVIALAKKIVSNDKKNEKIERHEQVIEAVTNVILSLDRGDYFTAESISNYCYYKENIYNGDRYKATIPDGATRVAINRLINRGEIRVTNRFIYTRIGKVSSQCVLQRV